MGWLLGDRASRVLSGIWYWLWGIPVASGGKVAEGVARDALSAMQQSVMDLAESVATLVAAYQRAREQYEGKVQESRDAEQQAVMAHQAGNEEAARMAMSKAILIETLLPQLREQVTQAEQVVTAAKDKLKREREKLETYKIQMQNLQAVAEVNKALATIARTSNQLDIGSAQSQFDTAQAAIEQNHLKVNARLEVLENPVEQLQAELDQMGLDAEITRRLERFYQNKRPAA